MTVAARTLDYIRADSGRAMSGKVIQYGGGDDDAATYFRTEVQVCPEDCFDGESER
jgi:hypothetical protein